jgi:hypothetical protein
MDSLQMSSSWHWPEVVLRFVKAEKIPAAVIPEVKMFPEQGGQFGFHNIWEKVLPSIFAGRKWHPADAN